MSVYKVFGTLDVEASATDDEAIEAGQHFIRTADAPDEEVLIVIRSGQPVFVITNEGEWI